MTPVESDVSVQNLLSSVSVGTHPILLKVLDKEKIIHFHEAILYEALARTKSSAVAFKEKGNFGILVSDSEIQLGTPYREIFETRINWIEQVVFDSFQLSRINISLFTK